MSIRFSSFRARSAIAAVSVASVTLLVAAPPAGAATTATDKKPTIDTYSDWDGGSILVPFGNPQTSNYGQTITVPDGNKSLKWFEFYMEPSSGSGTMKVRGEVYGWDGTKATTEVYESKAKKVTLDIADPTFQGVKIKTKGAKLTPGKQYVMFLTIDKDYDYAPGLQSAWPVHTTDDLPGGNTVWLNSDGDESQWTTVPWSGIGTYDMAFKAMLG